jgi:hypothetical protein
MVPGADSSPFSFYCSFNGSDAALRFPAMTLPLDGYLIRRGARVPSAARNPWRCKPFAASSLRDGYVIEAPP